MQLGKPRSYSGMADEERGALCTISASAPLDLLKLIGSYLGPPVGSRAFAAEMRSLPDIRASFRARS